MKNPFLRTCWCKKCEGMLSAGKWGGSFQFDSLEIELGAAVMGAVHLFGLT